MPVIRPVIDSDMPATHIVPLRCAGADVLLTAVEEILLQRFRPVWSQCGWSAQVLLFLSRQIIKQLGRRFESHCGPFASNLEQVANLRCAQVNSASYPSGDGK